MLNKNRLLALVSNQVLELILLPTEQCNFRCTYCYEDFSHGKMRSSVVLAVKNLLSQRIPMLDKIKISWFGGEPLAAKDVIYEISQHVLHLQKRYPRLVYTSGMTTNALQLTENVLRRLLACGVTTFQISLDGTEAMHNKTRRHIGGDGTFQGIWHNLLAARNCDLSFNIVLRIHVTPENVFDLYQLIDQIKAEFEYDARFSLFFKPIENLGGANAGTFQILHGKEKEEIVKRLQEHVNGALKVQTFNQTEPYVCYAAQTNSFVIRANGKISKCTVAFQDERNIIGELQPDGTLKIAADKLALWTRGIKSQDAGELSCPMQNMAKIALHS